MISFSRGSFQSFRLCCPGKGIVVDPYKKVHSHSFIISSMFSNSHFLWRLHCTQRPNSLTKSRQKSFFKVFFRLAIYSHFYGFALRFIFFKTHTAYGLRNLYKNLKSGTLKIMYRNLNKIVRSWILPQGRYPAKQHWQLRNKGTFIKKFHT